MKNLEPKTIEILAIDVGNTSILIAHISDGHVKKTVRVATAKIRSFSLLTLKKHFPLKKIQAAVIASVVPSAGTFLKAMIPRKLKLRTFLIGKDLAVPIKNLYTNPKQVGIDRLMNALAAFSKHRRAAIIIDFGTAITFDVVSKKGEYLGGVIAPGIEISLDALFQKTALLPRIRLAHPQSVIGKNTIESIRAGCSYGIGGLCERVVSEIKRQRHLEPVVMATGGYAHFMSRYFHGAYQIDPNLTLKGIFLTYKKLLDKNS